MIIIMKSSSTRQEIELLLTKLLQWNIFPELSLGKNRIEISLIGNTTKIDVRQVQNLSPFIEQVLQVKKPFKRASLEFCNGKPSEIKVPTPCETVTFGQNHPVVVIADICSVESEEMVIKTARRVKAAGAKFLRGGVNKTRISRYAFQGHGKSALELLIRAKEATSLGIITEVMNTVDLDKVAEVVDVIQIGARNMRDFSLLKKVGATGKPVLLKRGLAATIEDWLMSAEYILATGNPNVILCEHGIWTFDCQYTQNTLDISAIPVLRSLTHLPIMIDPSEATGKSEFVSSMSMASIAAGADSLMIEVHPNPCKVIFDGSQSLKLEAFEKLMQDLASISKFFGRWSKSNSPVASSFL